MRWAYLQLLSTSGLLELYKAIQKALEEDDRLPNGQKKYGVREFPDFRQEADEIERELDKRQREYVRIAW
jgi:hypothetical protein